MTDFGEWARLAHTIPIPGGEAGAVETLRIMEKMARSSGLRPFLDPALQELLIEILHSGSSPLPVRVLEWMQPRTVFEDDPAGTELIRTPETMAAAYQTSGELRGDCDDLATLAAAIGLALGLRARYIAVALSPGGPLEHVWADLRGRGPWVEIDVTREAQGIPARPRIFRRRTWTVSRSW